MNKNILLIGGGGYIGSYLVPQLLATGRKVTVLGRSQTPRYILPDGVGYISGDFTDASLIARLLEEHQEAIHLAYATVPNTSFDDPLADLLQNLPPTLQLFSEAAKSDVKLILVSSGGTVYGDTNETDICEKHPTNPISPYGVTKLTLENYAFLYAATRGLKFICVRPANAYGAGQRPFAGQGFIATAMASAIKGLPIKIFGRYGTVRDYLYVSDLASGIVSALEKGQLSQIYNIGSGTGLNNQEVIEAMQTVIGEHPIQIEHLAERPFDVKRNVLDSSKLKTETGWKPLVDLNEGLRLTHEWFKQQ